MVIALSITLAILALYIVPAVASQHSLQGDDSKWHTTKIATITKMYQQDIDNQGMDYPVVLQQFANPELQAAMILEQEYFDREQMSCHIGYDVLWDSQDPDYSQDKQFSITEKGWVQVSLAQGSKVYYELACDHAECQVADVIFDKDGTSLKNHLLETCR